MHHRVKKWGVATIELGGLHLDHFSAHRISRPDCAVIEDRERYCHGRDDLRLYAVLTFCLIVFLISLCLKKISAVADDDLLGDQSLGVS